jgi:hypothetical protein
MFIAFEGAEMARAQFQKGQKVWVESVGAWTQIEKINAVWAKGFDEPVRVSYDVGLGREFTAAELMCAVEDQSAAEVGNWRLLRARNKWQTAEDAPHHPYPGTYPVVVTDPADWGGWRVPAAEYDRSPERIEFQARLMVAAPELMDIVRTLSDLDETLPDGLPREVADLAARAREALRAVIEVLATPPDESAVARRARESVADGTRSHAA